MKEPTNAELADGRLWCIAGGWAACPQLASDQDVWVFAGALRHDSPIEDRLSRLARLRLEMLCEFMEITPEGPSIADSKGDHQDFDEDNLQRYGDMNFGVIKVGILGDRHILLTDAADIQQLLSHFDISTHQCAIDEDMNFIRGTGWTPITDDPKILRTGGEQIAVRLEKIRARYLAQRVQ